jgi:hypothetical protein
VLRAARRVLRPGGRLGFTTIHIPPGLPPRSRRRAAQAGPPAVAATRDYPALLRAAGFHDIVEVDLTADYLTTARAWHRHTLSYQTELAALRPGEIAERLARRRTAIAAIEAGLLRRSLFLAHRPRQTPADRDGTRVETSNSRETACTARDRQTDRERPTGVVVQARAGAQVSKPCRVPERGHGA